MSPRSSPEAPSRQVLSQIAEAIRSVRYGRVQILIHDSRVVQIEKVEKFRMEQDADLTTGGFPTTEGRTDRTTGGSDGLQDR